MKKLIFALLLTLLVSQLSYSQKKVKRDSMMVSFSIGYGLNTFEGADNYYNLVISNYQKSGISFSKQYDFNRTITFNTQILYNPVLQPMWIGASVGYSYSPAFSSYKDIAGTLKENGTINCFYFSLATRYTLDSVINLPIFFSLKLGANHYALSIEESVVFINLPQSNYIKRTSLSVWGPFLLTAFGTSINFSKIILSFEIGYQMTYLGSQKFILQKDKENPVLIPVNSCNQYGLLSLISVGYAF